jgi:hypothetical protein
MCCAREGLRPGAAVDYDAGLSLDSPESYQSHAFPAAPQFDGGVTVMVETLDTRPTAVAAAAVAVEHATSAAACSGSDEEAPIKVAPPPLRRMRKIGVLRSRG